MFKKTNSAKIFAPRRQDRKDGKEKYFSISPNLAPFAPWNTDSTEIELFAQSAIPRGELSFIRSFPLFLDRICLPRSTRRSRRIYNQIISASAFQTPRLASGYPSNLVSLCALRALRSEISLLGVLCARHNFSDSLKPNSKENFKYIWLGFSSNGARRVNPQGSHRDQGNYRGRQSA